MPSVSEAQHNAMEAAAHGHSTLGIPASVGKDFTQADEKQHMTDAQMNAFCDAVEVLASKCDSMESGGQMIAFADAVDGLSTRMDAWNESDHPRDGGKFTSAGAHAATGKAGEASSKAYQEGSHAAHSDAAAAHKAAEKHHTMMGAKNIDPGEREVHKAMAASHKLAGNMHAQRAKEITARGAPVQKHTEAVKLHGEMAEQHREAMKAHTPGSAEHSAHSKASAAHEGASQQHHAAAVMHATGAKSAAGTATHAIESTKAAGDLTKAAFEAKSAPTPAVKPAAANKQHVHDTLKSVGVTPTSSTKTYKEGGGYHEERASPYRHEVQASLAKKGFVPGDTTTHSPPTKTGAGRPVEGSYSQTHSHPSGVTANHSFGHGGSHIVYHVPPAK